MQNSPYPNNNPQPPRAEPPYARQHPGNMPPPPQQQASYEQSSYERQQGQGHQQQPAGNPFQPQYQWQPAQALPKERSVGTCILLYILTFGIYGLFWYYAMHKEHPSRKGVDDSPGWAVGLMFIPIFNIYWLIRIGLRLSDRFNLLAQQAGAQGEQVNKLFVWLQLVPYIGPVFNIIWWVQAHGVHENLTAMVLNAHAQARHQAGPQGHGL